MEQLQTIPQIITFPEVKTFDFKTYQINITGFLKGFNSQENSYLVEDYPYGFNLRCKIRFWVEYGGHKKAWRFCSQTTNPKKPKEFWNKPKYSTYAETAIVMFLDEKGHVKHDVLHGGDDLDKLTYFLQAYRPGLDEKCIQRLEYRIEFLKIYNEKKKQFDNWKEAYVAAYAEYTRLHKEDK